MNFNKIAVINFSGNQTKSTIAHHLLAPRLGNAQVISVESINGDESDESIRGKQFGDLIEALAMMDKVVVDVGSSNVEDFVNRMRQFRGSHEDFDLYVVPTVGAAKQQRDTISTIEALAEIGVPASKIRVVFSMLEPDERPDLTFAGIFDYHAATGKFTLYSDAVVHRNELFDRLRGSRHSIVGILSDSTDLKVKLKQATSMEDKLVISKQISAKRLAAGVSEELDCVFNILMR